MNSPMYQHAMNKIANLNPHNARAFLMTVFDCLYAKGEGTAEDPNRIDLNNPDPDGLVDVFAEITGLYLTPDGETACDEDLTPTKRKRARS